MLPLYYLGYLKVQTDEKIKIMMDEYKPLGGTQFNSSCSNDLAWCINDNKQWSWLTEGWGNKGGSKFHVMEDQYPPIYNLSY